MTALPKTTYTLEEYFELDRNAEGRYEYFDGYVFELSGVSPNHGRIERNLLSRLTEPAFAKGCEVFPANVRVRVPSLPTYCYPDLSAACGQAEFVEIGGLQCLANPVLLVEVLSDSTAAYDMNEKFTEYKSIESFREYVLFSQKQKAVTHYLKHKGRFWLQSQYTAGETVHIATLDYDLSVDDVYRGVAFTPGARPQPER
jgi:Uma2 family endonuclease